MIDKEWQDGFGREHGIESIIVGIEKHGFFKE
jgi:hypothetical protein